MHRRLYSEHLPMLWHATTKVRCDGQLGKLRHGVLRILPDLLGFERNLRQRHHASLGQVLQRQRHLRGILQRLQPIVHLPIHLDRLYNPELFWRKRADLLLQRIGDLLDSQ